MKKIAVVLLTGLWLAAVSMAATWTGWISDEKCGAKEANAGHLECARTCIKAGVPPVFVNDSGKVFKVANPEKVTDLAGQRVVLTGSEDNGTVKVQNVKAVPKPGSN
jgi:hypothetical protein